jgi:uncharacterized protein (TIGR03435 family)
MKHLTFAIIAFSLMNAGDVHCQERSEAKQPLAFEVATVKPSDPAARGGGIRPLPGGQTYVATSVPLRMMIKLMYGITDVQIVGGPDWINTDRFDVRAKAEKPSNLNELHEMFQTLLADRFKLQFHRETRTLPVYALVVDKPGKMKVDDSANNFDIPIQGTGRGQVAGVRVPMSYLAWFLSQQLNRPVLNKTDLDKFYAFTLQWTPELPPGFVPRPGEEPPPVADGPTIFTALREQLGLKLDSQKGPVEVFVIDSAQKPVEN